MSELSNPTLPPSTPPALTPRRPPFALWTLAGASLLGAVFAAVSTKDFIKHLDRQVHEIHCSFIPGASLEVGESGCRTVMLSPYSSVLRTSLWGGLPISLLALAVFAYLAQRAIRQALSPRTGRHDALYLVAATGLPLLMSAIFGFIAATKIGAVCKLCVGVYVSSGLAFAAAVWSMTESDPDDGPLPWRRWGFAFTEGVAFVALLSGLYVALAPTSAKPLSGCGTLASGDDPNGVMIRLADGPEKSRAIAVLDPLCPACKNFDARLSASGLASGLRMDAVLFPLDATCNWMVKKSLHPGACALSEAMLCDKAGAAEVLAYAFENQEALRARAVEDEAGLRRALEERFPRVKGCLGGPVVKSKLNKSLRWAVANDLPVLTPQLFIGTKRLCDEDTDLGLEYTLTRMLAAGSSVAEVATP